MNIKEFLPKVEKEETIGVYGGSFDPVHVSHVISITSVFLCQNIDQIWVLPTSDHAFKEHTADFEDRLKMAELSFSPLSNAYVPPLEKFLSSPNHTVETLSKVKEIYPSLNLKFLIGGDLVEEIPKWKNSEDLTDLADILVIPRRGYPIVDPPKELGDFDLVDLGVDLPEISSTKVKNLLERGGSIKNLVDQKVYQYIKEKNLYC